MYSLKTYSRILVLVILIALFKTAESEDERKCIRMESYSYIETIPQTDTYWETYTERCRVIFRCTKSRRRVHTSYRQVVKRSKRPVEVCCEDYTEDEDGKCIPQCSPSCVNASCVSPNQCECNTGYHQSEKPNVCEPTCSPECVNGYCITPGNCLCNPGYSDHDTKGTCKPICTKQCRNGTCIEPDVCHCNKGYVNSENGCVPYCSGCENGTCISPEICSCDKGYDRINGTCQPRCRDCINGKCIAPEKCECEKGFEFLINSTTNCIPVCSPKCSKDENCTSPNTCACKKGYEKTSEKCEPKCSFCTNGECSEPETCSCQAGYKNPNEFKDRCVPKCDEGCENGTCVAPGKCICNKGYLYDSGACHPVCNGGCYNGECVAPGQCACYTNYKFETGSNTICIPVCAGCKNGTCIEPNVCTCNRGFIIAENNTCVECRKCGANEMCLDSEKCVCKPGYKRSEGRMECLADCDFCQEEGCRHGCVNGTCTKPGTCICGLGYVLQDLSDNNTYCISENIVDTTPNTTGHDDIDLTTSNENIIVDTTSQASEYEEVNYASDENNNNMAWMYVGVVFLTVAAVAGVVVFMRISRFGRLSMWRRRSFNVSQSGSSRDIPVGDSSSTSHLYDEPRYSVADD